MVHIGLEDLKEGKRLFSNVKLKGLGRIPIKYLDRDMIDKMFELIKKKKLDLTNSTVMLQEAHNYVDARNSMSKKNKTFTYWILQSRHTGRGSCDIVYDTQEFRQVDLRLRQNTDHFIRPFIIEMIGEKPSKILLYGTCKIQHKWVRYQKVIDVYETCDKYDTHEIVYF